MAVPKRKQSKERQRTRFANYKADMPASGECPQCHEARLSHRVCRHCGYYDGVKRVDIEKKEKKSS